MNREDWLLARKMGIGSTDVAPILGRSPYRSAMSVWMEKKGLEQSPPDPGRAFLMQLGLDLEPVISKLYERDTGRTLVIPDNPPFRHAKYGCLLASPDRFVSGENRGVELKSENQFAEQFGDAGTAEVPVHYALQVAHQMAVCDVDHWDLAVLHGGARFRIYTLERDKEFEQLMCERLVEWWERYIIRDIPPEVDSSDAWAVYLRRRYPIDREPMLEANNAENLLLEYLGALRAIREEVEQREAETITHLKLRIGEHAGIMGQGRKVTWKRSKDKTQTDWKQVVDALTEVVPADTLRQLVELFTRNEPGVRRFLFTEHEEGKSYAGTKNAVSDAAIGLIEEVRRVAGDGAGSPGAGGDPSALLGSGATSPGS